MRTSRKLKSSILVLVISLAGCRLQETAEADKQPQGKFDQTIKPIYPAVESTNFALLKKDIGEITYSPASMVFFKQGFNPESAAKLLQLSKETRQRRAKVLALTDKTKQLQIQIAALKAKNTDILNAAFDYEEAEALAGEWFIKEVLPTASSDDLNTFRKICEAKVWEFAVSPLLLRKTPDRESILVEPSRHQPQLFKSPPTPLALCSKYYRKIKLYDHPACQPAKAGADYSRCLWQALTKTSWMNDRFFGNNIDDLTKIIDDKSEFAKLIAFASNAKGSSSILKGRYRGRPPKEFSRYLKIFRYDRGNAPYDILKMLKPTSDWALPAVAGREYNYKDMIYLFASRTTSKPFLPSLSDRRFHQLAVGYVYPPGSAIVNKRFTQWEKDIIEDFGDILNPVNKQAQTEIAKNNKIINEKSNQISRLTSRAKTLPSTVEKLRESAAFINHQKSLAAIFLGFSIELRKNADQLQVIFYADTTRPERLELPAPDTGCQIFEAFDPTIAACKIRPTIAHGCVNLRNDLPLEESCKSPGVTIPFKLLKYDDKTGRIRIALDLDLAQNIGLLDGVINDYFYEETGKGAMTTEDDILDKYQQLFGLTLQIDLYPNKLDGLNIATGKAFIKSSTTSMEDKNTYVYQGAISAFDDNQNQNLTVNAY